MPPAVIDACCLIDLLVSRHAEEILRASNYAWHVPTAVQVEAKYLRSYDPAQSGAYLNVPVDLAPYLGSGLLVSCQPDNPQEQARYIHYATIFRSDGEAMCLALAECRGSAFATDDRKAIKVAGTAGLTVLSSPQIVKAWVDAAQPDSGTIVQVLNDIQTLAHFRPNPTTPEAAWWLKQVAGP